MRKDRTIIGRKPIKTNLPFKAKRKGGEVMNLCKKVRDAAYPRMTENPFTQKI